MIFYGNGDELALFDDAMSAACMAWWLMELPSGTVFFNVNKIRMLGYSDKDASKFTHYKSFTDLVHPDDYDKAMKAMMDHLEGRAETYETVYRIKNKKGGYTTFFDKGKIVARNDQGETAIAGMVLDLSGIDALKHR